MAKIYDQKNEPGKPGPAEHAQKRGMVLLIALILGIFFIIMLYQMARGEELTVADMIFNSPTVSSFYLSDR